MAKKTDEDQVEEIQEETEGNEIEEASKGASKVNKLPDVQQWCSTGCNVLDFAISNQFDGGVPIGRVVHVFGGGSTAKTVLLTSILGYAQRLGHVAHFDDVEHTLDTRFASIFGLNCEDEKLFKLYHSETLEQFFDDNLGSIVYSNPKKKRINDKPKIVGVDSVTALPTEVELGEEMREGSFSLTRAKQMSKGFRKWLFPLAESNTTLICIDQTRDSIGSMFGPKEVTSGGRALEFYSSVQIYLKHDSSIKNANNVITGIWIKAKIVKNKVGIPFRECRFKVSFDYGIDDIASSIYFLMFHQQGEKAAREKTSKLKLFDQEMTQRNWIKHIEDNSLEADLKKAVWEQWQTVHKTEQRKPRTF